MPPARARPADGEESFERRLTRRKTTPLTKPRASFGRVAPLTRQRAVSLTVFYSKMEQCRTKDPEKALPGTVVLGGEQAPELIYRHRRGDVLFTAAQGPSFSSASALSNVPLLEVTSVLNRWDRRIPIRVVGIAENPSASRGADDFFGNGAGTCAGNGSNTMINNGPYHLVHGDQLYGLVTPETVDVNGVTFSASAIRGTGAGGSGDRADWNQKLVLQIVPLKTRNFQALVEGSALRAAERLERLTLSLGPWSAEKDQFFAALDYGPNSVVPGFAVWSRLEWSKQTLWLALRRHHYQANARADLYQVLVAVFRDAQQELAKYWKAHWDEFKRYNDPDSIARLHRNTGAWLLPVGYEDMRARVFGDPVPLAASAPAANAEDPMVAQLHDLGKLIAETQRYVVLNDLTPFFDQLWIGMVISPEAMPGSSVNIVR